MDLLATLTAEKPVVIFSKSTCCISHTVKALICSFGANPTVIEIDKMENGQQIERALIQLGRSPTVPAVFIGQQLIGSAGEVISLNVQNKLAVAFKGYSYIYLELIIAMQFKITSEDQTRGSNSLKANKITT